MEFKDICKILCSRLITKGVVIDEEIRIGFFVMLLIVICAGCALVSRKITGKVLVNGATPDRTISVKYVVNDGSAQSVTTDTNGYYTIPSTAYNVGDKVRISISGTSNYGSPIEAMKYYINSWTGISTFTTVSGAISVPDLDLYNDGSGITKPEGYEYVTFPYSVQFGVYSRTVSNKEHWLYFYDESNQLIGFSDVFNSSPYYFDGTLTDDSSLAQNAFWYLGVSYQENGYNLFTNSYNTHVYYGVAPASLTQHDQAVKETLEPVFK